MPATFCVLHAVLALSVFVKLNEIFKFKSKSKLPNERIIAPALYFSSNFPVCTSLSGGGGCQAHGV